MDSIIIIGLAIIVVSLVLIIIIDYKNNKKFIGYLVIADDEEDGPYAFIEFKVPIDQLSNNDRFQIEVRRKRIL